MATLADEDLFTLPLTFMGVPYGRPGPAIARPSWGCRSIAASIRFVSARAADQMPYVCSHR